MSLGGVFAFPLGDSAAGGLLVTAGNQKKELLFNTGFQVGDAQRVILTLGQMRQYLNIGFISGSEKTEMTQNSGAVSYQFRLKQGVLNGAEINGYLANTPSRDLVDKTYARDTATFYELWNDPRRVAGGRVTGLQGRLVFTPLPGSTFKLGAGGERLENDYFTGKQSTTRATGSAEWLQCLAGDYQIKAGADAAVQRRYTLGMERSLGDSGLFGASFAAIRGLNGAPNDNQIKLTWSYALDGKRATSGSCGSAAQVWGSLLDEVAKRPTFLPSQVIAKLDTTAVPLRRIAINKAALPVGSAVNASTGVITTPLGVAVTGIAGVTLNAATFTNAGQFALSGNNLVIDPNKITQPAVGAIDTYVVTVNNAGGGTTLVTLMMSHGSVKIDSISIASGAADLIAPTTTAAPAVSNITSTGTTLSVTINENGTGYYLVQAAAAAAPTVAAVQAGTAFAMTANVAATPAISGLTASTAYKIYFVAKDVAGNVQAAVQNVAVTTSANTNTNTAPTANNFTYGTNIDNVAKTFSWLALSAAADADGDPLTATVQAQGAKGTFVVAGNNVTYTPSANQTVSDSGTLRISDGRGGVKDITVTVNGIDTQPPAAPTGLALNAGAATTIAQTITLDGLTTPADADLAAWYIIESTTAPAAGAGPVNGGSGWLSTKPNSYGLFTATNETKTVCVYVKDTLGNVQQTGACDTIVKVP